MNLQQKLDSVGNIADFLRNQQTGPNVYPGVPAEFTNWRDEQWAWQHSCVLFNQSYHMVDLAVEGPDAFAMLEHLGINSFKGFVPDKAKQFVPCTPGGYVIGDVILFYLAENRFNLVGRAPVIEWVEFHAATGGWDVAVERDERTALRSDGRRRSYRFQIQGPNAMKLIERVLGGPPPELKFFNMAEVEIADRTTRALRHGMAGQPGLEFFGPWDDGETVREALVEAGRDFGLRQVGGRAYSSNTLESGWIPSPLPAVYTDESLRPFREWLSEASYPAKASIGGSFVSDRIEDYYLTPWDLGYGHIIRFDHDFIGREALERMAGRPHRRKVTLALDDEDVARVWAGMLGKGDRRPKYMDFPSAVYAMHPFDLVVHEGRACGLSTWIGYSYNEGKMLTLAMLDAEHAEPGAEVSLLWGEPGGGSRKPTVEPHAQTWLRAIVSPIPYAEVARKVYADGGWRAARIDAPVA